MHNTHKSTVMFPVEANSFPAATAVATGCISHSGWTLHKGLQWEMINADWYNICLVLKKKQNAGRLTWPSNIPSAVDVNLHRKPPHEQLINNRNTALAFTCSHQHTNGCWAVKQSPLAAQYKGQIHSGCNVKVQSVALTSAQYCLFVFTSSRFCFCVTITLLSLT